MTQPTRVDAGFLESYGLTPYSEEELRARKGRAMVANATQNATTNKGAAALGALLGKAVFGNPELSEDEQRKVAIKTTADQNMAEFEADSAYANLPIEEKNWKYREELARAAYQQGDYAMGGQIALELAQEKRAAKLAKLEIEQAGLDIEGTEAEIADKREQTKGRDADRKRTLQEIRHDADEERRKKSEEYGTYFLPGPTGAYPTGLDALQSNSVQARVDENGNLRIIGQDEVYQGDYLHIDDYDTMVDNLPKDKNGKPISLADTLKDDPSLDIQSKIMQLLKMDKKEMAPLVAAYNKQGEITLDVLKLMNEQYARGTDASVILDGQGKLVTFADNMTQFIGSVVDDFNVVIDGADKDLNGKRTSRETLMEFAEKYEADALENIKLPPELERRGIDAAKYQANIVQLAYAVARANEPGARQLSDTDFRNALREIGAASGNPRAVMEIIRKRMLRGHTALKQDFKGTASRVDAILSMGTEDSRNAFRDLGISGKSMLGVIYGKANMARSDELVAEIDAERLRLEAFLNPDQAVTQQLAEDQPADAAVLNQPSPPQYNGAPPPGTETTTKSGTKIIWN